ncbi:hypothetical protein lerEdw1_013107 [Lerista edwardsae]|nr:hypothetical protein lerEdw1_013107 [Lerista edwardsae]
MAGEEKNPEELNQQSSHVLERSEEQGGVLALAPPFLAERKLHISRAAKRIGNCLRLTGVQQGDLLQHALFACVKLLLLQQLQQGTQKQGQDKKMATLTQVLTPVWQVGFEETPMNSLEAQRTSLGAGEKRSDEEIKQEGSGGASCTGRDIYGSVVCKAFPRAGCRGHPVVLEPAAKAREAPSDTRDSQLSPEVKEEGGRDDGSLDDKLAEYPTAEKPQGSGTLGLV